MTLHREPPGASIDTERASARPLVAGPAPRMPLVVPLVIAVLAGVLLFMALNARRQALTAPAVSGTGTDLPAIEAPPPLHVPPPAAEIVAAPLPATMPTPAPTQLPSPVEPFPPRAPSPVYPYPIPPQPPYSPPINRNAGGPALIIDTSQGATPSGPPEARNRGTPTGSSAQPGMATDRARAGMFANRSTTVPQGTLIPAVLETGFDSTRPGFARALVQSDIRGFDGSQVLIPRGSRLIGEYGSDNASGQHRAAIAWSRLIRPDGMTIEIASPAADTVGRGGIRAEVDSHFWERFGGAILQSSLDIGANLASRTRGGSIVVMPGGTQPLTGPLAQQDDVRPTLRVGPGTSVSVFVARDLDFTATQRTP